MLCDPGASGIRGIAEFFPVGYPTTLTYRDETEQGAYGVCTSCGEPIARKRLEAIPEALLCTACQTRMELEEKAVRKAQAPGPREWEEAEDIVETDEDFRGAGGASDS
jgi:hypothetical protein